MRGKGRIDWRKGGCRSDRQVEFCVEAPLANAPAVETRKRQMCRVRGTQLHRTQRAR